MKDSYTQPVRFLWTIYKWKHTLVLGHEFEPIQRRTIMDLRHLQEQVVQQEARALDLGMASPSPHLLEELQYALQDVAAIQALLPDVGMWYWRARLNIVYAELLGIQAQRTYAKCAPTAA